MSELAAAGGWDSAVAAQSLGFKPSPFHCRGERRVGEEGDGRGVRLVFRAISWGLLGLRVLWAMLSERRG